MAIYLGENLVSATGGQPVNSTIVNENKIVNSGVTQQVILPDQGYTGIGQVTINPIQLKKEVIRPDAELFQSWTYDKNIKADESITIPAYTTSTTTLKSYITLSSTTTLDTTNYDYFLIYKYLAIPKYNISTVGTGRVEYYFAAYYYEYVNWTAHSIVNPSTSVSVGPVSCSNSHYRLLYYNGTTLTAYSSTSYGTYLYHYAPSLSNNTLTIYSPYLRIRGSTNYFTQTYWEALTDIRYQYIIEMYRVPKGSLGYSGWALEQEALDIINSVENNNGKLT